MTLENDLNHLWTLAVRAAVGAPPDSSLADLLAEIGEELTGTLEDLRTLPSHRVERLPTTCAFELGLLPSLEIELNARPLDELALEDFRKRCLRPLRRYIQDQ